MAELRLSKLIRQYRVGLDRLVEELHQVGFDVESNVNAKVSDECIPVLDSIFTRPELPNSSMQASEMDEPIIFKLKVIQVDDLGRVITEGFSHPQFGYFDAGILLPQLVFDKGNPIPLDLAIEYNTSLFTVGSTIHALYYSSCLNESCALLAYEASYNLFNEEDRDYFENNLTTGELYTVYIDGETPNYYLLSIEASNLKAVIKKEDVPAGASIEKLQLAKKATNISGYSLFVWPAIIQEIDDSYTDDIVAKFLGDDAMSVISEEDITLVKLILQKNPKLKRNTADIVGDVDLYVRLSDDYRLSYEHHKNEIENRVFWMGVNLTEQGEEKLYLYHEKPTVVIEFTLDNDVFRITKIVTDSDRGGDAKYFIGRFNRRACLKIPFGKVHLLDPYGAYPVGYKCQDVFEYLFHLDDFNRNILSRIEDTLQERIVENAHDYKLLESYLRFQSKKEVEKAGEPIELAPGRIQRGTSDYLGGNPTLAYYLSEQEIRQLIPEPEASGESTLHVSVFEYDGMDYIENRFYASTLSFRDGLFYQTFKNPNVSLDQFLSDGIIIGRTSNTKPFDIQVKAINAFLRNKEGVFHDLVVGKIETPNEAKYKNLRFFNSKFYAQEEGSHQCDAVRKALGNKSLLLIQGPPGTGKTTIIVEIIKQLVKEGKKVLVCSQAHAAVGNIRERFNDNVDNLKILRIDDDGDVESWAHLFKPEEYEHFLANNKQIVEQIFSNTLDEESVRIKINSYQYGTDSRTSEYREMHNYVVNNREVLTDIDRDIVMSMFPTLMSAPSDIDRRMLEAQLYQSMDVVMGTCVGIGMNNVLGSGIVHFDTVIIDEAAKANLSETLVPMRLGDRFVLVGDHNQLPPYVDREEIMDFLTSQEDIQDNESNDVEKVRLPKQSETFEALSNSVFAYFYNHANFPEENKITLNYQYRMHPVIGEYISKLFYQGGIKSGKGTEKNVISLPGYPDAVTFIDTSSLKYHYESKSPDLSLYNSAEVHIICNDIIPRLLPVLAQNSELKLGIITPYKAQRNILKKELADCKLDECVYTIDSIQGSEFDVVVFSFVRSFAPYINKKVEFIDDMRRLNVSLSRAKRKLILVGDSMTLLNENAHVSNLAFSVKPIDVFRKICSTKERISDADELYLFLQNEPSKGTIFTDCPYSDQGGYLVVQVNVDGRLFKFKVAKTDLGVAADTVDVVYKGSVQDNKPQFRVSNYRQFKKRHKLGDVLEGRINNILPAKEPNQYIFYFDVEGVSGRLSLDSCTKTVGESLKVRIIQFDDEKGLVIFGHQKKPAQRMMVVKKSTFPTLLVQDLEGVQSVITIKNGWEKVVPGFEYYFSPRQDGISYILELEKSVKEFYAMHRDENSFPGTVASEDDINYYVDVDGVCCIIRKQVLRKAIRMGETHVFSVYRLFSDSIHLKLVR